MVNQFLGYKVNINFRTEKLPYSQIGGTKVGTSYKKRRHSPTSSSETETFTTESQGESFKMSENEILEITPAPVYDHEPGNEKPVSPVRSMQPVKALLTSSSGQSLK